MADVGGIGAGVGIGAGIANLGPVGGIASAAPAASTTAAPAATNMGPGTPALSPFTSAAQLNTLVQGLNNIAATSSVLQPFSDQLTQLNTMVANIDVNTPLARQPLSDTIAALLLALLDEMNRQNQNSGNGGGSPLIDMILAQALTQPTVGVFINTSA